jgi:hypothetical protein
MDDVAWYSAAFARIIIRTMPGGEKQLDPRWERTRGTRSFERAWSGVSLV